MNKVLVDRKLLENLVSLWAAKGYGKEGSPGHCHEKPGIWDKGNGPLAGKPCAECAIYDAARAILAQPAEAEVVGVPVVATLLIDEVFHGSNGPETGDWDIEHNPGVTEKLAQQFPGEAFDLVRQVDHLAALSSVTAERDRLLSDNASLRGSCKALGEENKQLKLENKRQGRTIAAMAAKEA